MGDVIVVGTDGSETAKQAVTEAVRLAKALSAELHLVSAFEPLRAHVTGAPEGAARVWAPRPDDQVEATLSDAASRVRLAEVPVTTSSTWPERSEPQ
jgi:nucleotide-binding universal stress UspA family protein